MPRRWPRTAPVLQRTSSEFSSSISQMEKQVLCHVCHAGPCDNIPSPGDACDRRHTREREYLNAAFALATAACDTRHSLVDTHVARHMFGTRHIASYACKCCLLELRFSVE